MSLIHIYLDKSNDSSREVIDLLRSKNIDFLQTNVKNTEETLKNYKLQSLPAIKFKDNLVYDITENSINGIISKFNSYICTLPNTTLNHNTINTKEDSDYKTYTLDRETLQDQSSEPHQIFKKINATKVSIKNKPSFSNLSKKLLESKK